MKKLNNKGFTLVELLAVIIILAIVVGITIPAVLTTTTKTKEKAFKTAAQTVATWVDSQYQVAKSGLDGSGMATLDTNFKTQCGPTGSSCEGSGKEIAEASFIVAAGLETKNVSKIKVVINAATGRSCVTLTAVEGGDYSGTDLGETTTGGAC